MVFLMSWNRVYTRLPSGPTPNDPPESEPTAETYSVFPNRFRRVPRAAGLESTRRQPAEQQKMRLASERADRCSDPGSNRRDFRHRLNPRFAHVCHGRKRSGGFRGHADRAPNVFQAQRAPVRAQAGQADDVHVDALESSHVAAERFPQEPTHAVSPDRAGNDPAADGQAQASLAVLRENKKEMGASHFRRGGELEITAVEKPSRLGKRSPLRGFRHYFVPVVTVRRFRPFCRRRFRTKRPSLRAIRSRKPWVRFRLIRLG